MEEVALEMSAAFIDERAHQSGRRCIQNVIWLLVRIVDVLGCSAEQLIPADSCY